MFAEVSVTGVADLRRLLLRFVSPETANILPPTMKAPVPKPEVCQVMVTVAFAPGAIVTFCWPTLWSPAMATTVEVAWTLPMFCAMMVMATSVPAVVDSVLGVTE